MTNTNSSSLIKQIHSGDARDSLAILRLYQEHILQSMGAIGVTWTAAYQGSFGRKVWSTELMDNWKVIEAVYPRELKMTHQRQARFKRYLEMAANDELDPMMAWAIKQPIPFSQNDKVA